MNREFKTLLIIPAYNEEDSILSLWKNIQEYPIKYDVIVINDGSTDATRDICEQNGIPIINLVHNLGIGGAVQTGYKYASENNYDIAVQFDGDGQHDIRYVEEIIRPIKEDKADLVIGSRFVTGSESTFKSSAARQIGIKIISSMIYVVTRKKVWDVTSGFRACNKTILTQFSRGYPIEYPEPITNTELLRKGKRVLELPVVMHERAGGNSSIHSWKNIYFMVNILLSICIIGIRRKSK